MNNTTKLLALIAGILVVIALAVVIVGLVNGTWPWDNNGWFSGNYNGLPGKDTTASTGDDTTGDPTNTTGDSTGDSTDNTTGNTTADPTGTTSGNSSNQGNPVQKEEGDITLDITIGVDTTPDDEDDDEAPTSNDSGNQGNSGSISFSDLLDAANKGNK